MLLQWGLHITLTYGKRWENRRKPPIFKINQATAACLSCNKASQASFVYVSLSSILFSLFYAALWWRWARDRVLFLYIYGEAQVSTSSSSHTKRELKKNNKAVHLPSVSSTCLRRRCPREWRLFLVWGATARFGKPSPSAIPWTITQQWASVVVLVLHKTRGGSPPQLVKPVPPDGPQEVSVGQHHGSHSSRVPPAGTVHVVLPAAMAHRGPGTLEDGGEVNEVLAENESSA